MQFLRLAGLAALCCSIVLVAGLVPQPAMAANALVSGETCSHDDLAAAITTASGGGTVTFDCENPAISFAAGEQIVIHMGLNVIIDGSNSGQSQIILQGGGSAYQTNFFRLESGGTLTVQHLTMQNGKAPAGDVPADGGAIDNDGGTLTVIACTFHNNKADYGGAINNNPGTLTISQSNFSNNQAEFGGAISTGTTVTISQSSFVSNHASGHGGVIETTSSHATIQIVASTFTNNTAADSASVFKVHSGTSLSLRWSTIFQEAGTTPAIDATSTLVLEGVILGGDGEHCELGGQYSLTDSYTLSNDGSCELSGIGSQQHVANLSLGSLTTQTLDGVQQSYHPVLQDSRAIDAGPTSCGDNDPNTQDFDQLRTPRPHHIYCDIGAIESVHTVDLLCVNRWNGQLSLAKNDNCDRSERRINPRSEGQLTLCVQHSNGTARASEHCSRSERQLIARGDGTLDTCTNRWNGSIRVSNHCSRSEYPDAI